MLIATLLAAAAWTAPVPVERPPAAYAYGALGGSLLGGFLERRAVLAKRSGGGFGPFTAITAADRHETVWASGLAQDGTAVVLTVRRHTPTPDQAFAEAGGLADVGIALGPGGVAQLAYADSHFDSLQGPSSLRVAQGTAGEPLSAPVVLSKGGKGANSGRVVDAAFSGDGTSTVVWARPGNRNETGGTLEVFTRAAGGAFGPPEVVAEGAKELTLATGPGASAVLGWTLAEPETHVASRAQAGGPFGPDQKLADRGSPSVAMTPLGEAIALWGGFAAFHPPDQVGVAATLWWTLPLTRASHAGR